MEEDNRQVNGARAALRLRCSSLATKGNNCPVNNTSIVASRGELARNNYTTARETPAPSTVRKTAVNANGTRAKSHYHFPKQLFSNEVAASVDRDKSQRPIRKSFSVPDYLRESTYIPAVTRSLFSRCAERTTNESRNRRVDK